MKTLVLGLGNPILGDDGVGLRVAEDLKDKIKSSDVEVLTTELGGVNLLEFLAGYDVAIIVDAIKTPWGTPGQIHRLRPESLYGTLHTSSTHNFEFATTIELGKTLNLNLPGEIIIFAIEAADVNTFSEGCTAKVEKAIPLCVNKILEVIQKELLIDKIS